MLIKSNFKDYYDGLCASDKDPHPLYLRIKSEYDLSTYGGRTLSKLERDASAKTSVMLPTRDMNSVVPPFASWCSIAFCGRLHSFLSVLTPDGKHTYCHTINQYRRALENLGNQSAGIKGYEYLNFITKIIKAIDSEEAMPDSIASFRGCGVIGITYRSIANLHNLRALEAELFAVRDIKIDLHSYFKSPIVGLINNDTRFAIHKILVNPTLKEFGFPSVMDITQMWQELSMYLGNQMADVSMVPPKPISDELRAETHGFDRKTSFRKTKATAPREKLDRSKW